MGSFFLPNDYRNGGDYDNDDHRLGYKKETGMNQSIFGNNLCFANIKKGLGFASSEVAVSSTTGNEAASNTDQWNYNRARSSPIVERLILEEIQNDIAEYAVTIGVSMDPKQWCVEDTRKWLQWVSALYQIGDPTNCLSFDGPTLCGFTDQDFVLLTGSEDTGLKIAAQLDLWKNATRMTPSAGSYHFQQQQQQQAMNEKLGITSLSSLASNTPKLLDAGCSWTSAGQQFSLSGMLSNTDQYTNNSTVDNTPIATLQGSFQDMANPQFQGFSTQTLDLPSFMNEQPGQSASRIPLTRFLNDPPQGRNTPRPTIPLDRFRSVRESCQDNGFLTWEKYQEFTSVTPNRNLQNPVFGNSSKGTMHNPLTTPIYNINKPKDDTVKPQLITAMITPKLEVLPPSLETTDDNTPLPDYTTLNTVKTEAMEAETAPKDGPSTSKGTEKAAKKKSSKHPIHLWEFLKQLLVDGKDCIKWVDQEKGVFRISNSQEVAKFWGERKNRPAMNYDKLSRSIRQYYKKGIIKKTSQGKRLVYQFCQGYL